MDSDRIEVSENCTRSEQPQEDSIHVWPGACSLMGMKPMTLLGIVLIIIGVFLLVSQGITYTKTEKVLDIGPVEATTHRQKTIPISPVAGGVILAAGVVLVISGAKRRS